MNRKRRGGDLYIEKADELLQDGEWKDGLEFARQVMRAITPGVAERRARKARQHGRPAEEYTPPPVPTEQLVQMGKRILIKALIYARTSSDSWETDPNPLPAGAWREGGWAIRDARGGRISITELKRTLRLDVVTVRQLIMQDPPLKHRSAGRQLSIDRAELPALEKRKAEYEAASTDRRREGSIRRWERESTVERDRIALSDLARRSRVAVATARKIADCTPELGWIRNGRVTHLPKEQIPKWNDALERFRESAQGRYQVRALKAADVRRAAREAISPPKQ